MDKSSLSITTQQPAMEQALQLSIQNLLKSWLRRLKLKRLLSAGHPSEETARQPAWRNNLVAFLESQQVRYAVIVLLLVDLVLTTLELTSSLLSCHQSNNPVGGRGEERARVYYWLGIAILGLLLAKTLVLAGALGAALLRRRPGLVVDAVVLVVALAMETFLERRGGGLVVVVSLWRVVRIVESAFELSDDAIEAQIAGVVAQFESLKDENRRLSEDVAEKERALEKVLEDLASCKERGE